MLRFAVFALGLLVAVTAIPASPQGVKHFSADEASALFERWAEQHGRSYHDDDEKSLRLATFWDNLEFVRRHNDEHSLGLHKYSVELNAFADLNTKEFVERHASGAKTAAAAAAAAAAVYADLDDNNATIPESVDWRKQGCVTPVSNQGQCGSSWAYGAVASLECSNFFAKKTLVKLSVQELLECDTTKSYGCNGGLMDDAFDFVKANGLDSEADYPYTASQGQVGKCNAKKEAKGAKVASLSSYVDLKPNEQALAAGLAKSVVAIAVDASDQGFQLYKSGVYDGTCGSQVDHGASLVGYGPKFFILKNQWDVTWGENGYMRLERGVGGTGKCGIAASASYSITK